MIGCQDVLDQEGSAPVGEVKGYDGSAIADRFKAIGVQVGADLYMVPTGIDDEGCEVFNPYSDKNPVNTALHFRQADGSFGIARDPAVCRVDMVAMAPDDDGCARYRAVPINGDLPPLTTEIIYHMSTDGSYSPQKPRNGCA